MTPFKALSIVGVLAMASMAAGSSFAQSPMTAPRTPLSSEPRAIAAQVATLLETYYLYPDAGRTYAARIRDRAASGAYDQLTGTALANALTSDLLSVRDDRHLRVRVGAPQTGLMTRPDGPGRTGVPGPQPSQGPGNLPAPGGGPGTIPAVEQAGWIAPGIAYIRFNEFPPIRELQKRSELSFVSMHRLAR